MAKKLELLVLVSGNTLDQTTHVHQDSKATPTERYAAVGVTAVSGWWYCQAEDKERVACRHSDSGLADETNQTHSA